MPVASGARRIDLLEALDRLIAYEHYYRSVYGHFTKLLPRVGYTLPAGLAEEYDVRVSEASTDRLLVTAFGESNGRATDFVSIDQDYQVRANFDLPPGRPEYLRAHAQKLLRALRDAPRGLGVAEQGVFRGYFQYDTREDDNGRRTAFALGTRAPMVGVQIEVGARESEEAGESDTALAQLQELTGQFSALAPRAPAGHTGQVGVPEPGTVVGPADEAYLAQRIFYGEVGRYARSWAELSKVTHFRFDQARPLADADLPSSDRRPSATHDEHDSGGLVIEPLAPGEVE